MGAGLFLLLIVASTVLFLPSSEVQAPILALVSGAFILTGLFPAGRPERKDSPALVGTLAGAIAAILAAGYWLYDATGGNLLQPIALALFGATTLAIIALMPLLILWGATSAGTPKEPDEMNRKAKVKQVKRGLYQASRETTSAGGNPYSRYNPTISMLFSHSWSMLENPFLWTYDHRQHQNLVENYLVEWLEITAKIAVSDHPYQCKYGEIAYNLAQQAKFYLERVRLITELDPLSKECPECKEALPTHKANCMAAICWKCKQPTPPQNGRSQNITVITPECYRELFCTRRGEEVRPLAPVVPRVPLPCGIPMEGEHQRMNSPTWPTRDKLELQRLLTELQKIEDDICAGRK